MAPRKYRKRKDRPRKRGNKKAASKPFELPLKGKIKLLDGTIKEITYLPFSISEVY